ncbi:MAG: hypothetical protein VXY93_12285, partial [Pseudomonadota bacterium]|nr:hypothetical protein [Pseudomonadota bacterium]
NREINGVVGTGTETYSIGNLVSTSSTTTSLNVTGVTTAVTLDVNGDLDVDGHTNLDNVSIAGVSTFTGDATFNGGAGAVTIAANSDIRFPNGNWTGDVAGKIQHHATSLYLQGGVGGLVFRSSGGTNRWHIEGNGHLEPATAATYDLGHNVRRVRRVFAHTFIGNGQLGILTTTEIDLNGDLDVDGHTNLDNVSISGFTTITQDLDVDGHTNLDNVSVAGVTTFNANVKFDGANAGRDITFERSQNSLVFADDALAKFGNSEDFKLFHDGSNSYIRETGTGSLVLQSNETKIVNGANNETIAKFIEDGAVELYHDNIKRLETSSVGVSIPQDLDVDGHTNLDNVSIAG